MERVTILERDLVILSISLHNQRKTDRTSVLGAIEHGCEFAPTRLVYTTYRRNA